jgi:hypothetical protein
MDTMHSAALLGVNMYERVILRNPDLSLNGRIEKIKNGEASEDQILAFLHLLEITAPQKLFQSAHPSLRLWPEEIVGLGALCGLPEDKDERKAIRKAVNEMFDELERTKGRRFWRGLVKKNPGLFNGQPLVPHKQAFNLTANHLLVHTS